MASAKQNDNRQNHVQDVDEKNFRPVYLLKEHRPLLINDGNDSAFCQHPRATDLLSPPLVHSSSPRGQYFVEYQDQGHNVLPQSRIHPDSKNWKTEETEKLIELWQEKEELYNVSHPLFNNPENKNVVIKNFAEELETKESEVLKKMKSLKGYFMHLSRQLKEKEVAKPAIRWRFFESLKFVEQGLPDSESTDTVSTEYSDSGIQRQEKRKRSNDAEPIIPLVTSVVEATDKNAASDASKEKKNEDQLFAESINPLMTRVVKAFEKDVTSEASKEKKNEDQLFGEMIGVQLSKIADGEHKDDAKMDILTSLHQLKRKMRKIDADVSL